MAEVLMRASNVPTDLAKFFTPVVENISDVFKITPQPFKEAHFATFPVELAARCIDAGTSERGACPHCGALWERVTESHFEPSQATNGRSGKWGGGDDAMSRTATDGRKARGMNRVSTLDFRPVCTCPAHEPVPCTVFDPFLGAATTIVAAEQSGRLGRGIELSPQYVAIALERLEGMGLRPRLDVGQPVKLLGDQPADGTRAG